jgi:hypothetical protein
MVDIMEFMGKLQKQKDRRKPEFLRAMHGATTKQANRSRRRAGLYGQRMRMVSASFIAGMTGK